MVTEDARFLQRSRDLRHLLNGEWITPVLVALRAGPLHYQELHRAIQEMPAFDPWTGTERRIQSRALSRTLRRMETAGLVDRLEERTFPRAVVYSLTSASTDLLVRVRPLIDWADKHLDLIGRLQKSPENDAPPGDDQRD